MPTPLLPPAIFNTVKSDYSMPKIILGEAPGLLDSIHNHHPKMFSLYKRLRKLDWDELEFDFSSCMTDFETCDKSTYDMMFKTLIWQWEADSIASRSIVSILAPVITDSRVWAAYLRIGENECLIDGTEVLTPTGWVDLKDTTTETKVAQYDPETKDITFVNPSRVIEEDFEGTLHEFRNHYGHYHQVVTPNHRMIRTSLQTGENEVKYAEDFDFKQGAAERRWSALNAGFTRGTNKHLTSLERMLIAIESDGSTSDRYTGEISGTLPVRFTFTKKRKIVRIYELANALGWKITHVGKTEYGPTGNERYDLRLSVPVEYKDQLKNFSWVDLEDKDSQWAAEFLEEMIEWDGFYTKNTGILHTTSKAAAELMQALAVISGHRSHLGYREDGRSENFSPTYRSTWKKQLYTSGQTISKTDLPYKGKVRCVTVPTGFFMIRYKGAVSVTGNCVHALTYSEIVRNSFVNPDVILTEVMEVREAQERMVAIAAAMDGAHKATYEYALGLRQNDQSMFNDVFMFFIALYMLERIQFMASFAITFAICKTGLFQPIGHAVKKIAQDEFEIHAQYGQEVIRTLLKTKEGAIAYQQCKPKMVELLIEVMRTETTWVEYLFSEGRSLPGINAKKVNDWTLFNTNAVKVFLGVTDEELSVYAVEFKELTGNDLVFPTTNPLPYMEDYMDISAAQGSPQEEKSKSDYQVNLLDSRNEDEFFDTSF